MTAMLRLKNTGIKEVKMFTKESIAEANKALNTVGIEKGKKTTHYVMVNERVKAFRSICPAGRITTKIVCIENGIVTMMAEVADEAGNVIATGFAQEKESSSFINKTSYIENCETSAVGRALGFAGIGIDGSMASAEEVANAIMNQRDPAIDRTGQPAYPTREEMLAVVSKHYPEGKMREALLSAVQAQSLETMSDAAVKAVYNKCMEKKK